MQSTLRNEKDNYEGVCNSTIHSACSRDISGGYSDGVPPLPIPNREVKPDRADGTAHPRESRSPPFYNKPRDSKETRGFVAFGRSEGLEKGMRSEKTEGAQETVARRGRIGGRLWVRHHKRRVERRTMAYI